MDPWRFEDMSFCFLPPTVTPVWDYFSFTNGHEDLQAMFSDKTGFFCLAL